MASTVSTTTLSFGLVSAPIKLKKIVGGDKKGTSFNLASPDGHPVKQRYMDVETGEILPTDENGTTILTKGIFTADGFKEVGTETLKQIDEECALDDLTIEGFIPLDQVPLERSVGAYFVAPGGKGASAVKPLALLRDGLTLRQVAGFGRVTLRSKTYPFVVRAVDTGAGIGLVVNTMEYATAFSAITEAGTCLEGAETDEKTLQLAGTLIDQLTVSREKLDALADDRFEKREALVAKVLAGEKIEVTEKPVVAKQETDDLAALLLGSIAAEAPAPKKSAKKDKVAATA